MQQDFMQQALIAARNAGAAGEVPVGAVLLDGAGAVIAVTGNRTEQDYDPLAHAEILAIREACRQLGETRLAECSLYVTLEPCALCAAAISLSRIKRLYFGAYDPKGGAVEHGPKWFSQPTCLHKPEIYGGILEAECGAVLKEFFKGLR